MKINENWREEIRKCREEKKLSRKRLAELIGCSASTITAIELGLRDPSLKMYIRIFNVFNE